MGTMLMQTKTATEMGERLAFELYLRTGMRVPPEIMQTFAEYKFNPYHDPDDGRFTFKPGGGTLAPKANSGSPRLGPVDDFMLWMRGETAPKKQPAPAPSPGPTPTPARPARRANPGALSAKHESSRGGNPGEVSSGIGDAGGISYGKYQLSSSKGTALKFVESPEAARWSRDFKDLVPGTQKFSEKWREVAARERDLFGAAQDSYIGRTHYDAAVGGVLRSKGLNLDASSEAVRQVTWSVAVQHGGAVTILRDAIDQTDFRLKRSEAGYQAALINAIYDRRTRWVVALRDKATKEGRRADASTFTNILTNRFPAERADALRILTAK
jgi:hypothetical protein